MQGNAAQWGKTSNTSGAHNAPKIAQKISRGAAREEGATQSKKISPPKFVAAFGEAVLPI
jgi:hypothetical protein